jgi:hypothetical protein
MNRRNLLTMLGMSPVALATVPTLAAKEKKPDQKKSAVTSGGPRLEVLNPRGLPPPITLIPMAKRLDTLDGKTIYLVSDGFPGADAFLNQISIWFKKNMPSVTTVYRLKAGGFADDDPKLMAELKDKANGVIMAIGH